MSADAQLAPRVANISGARPSDPAQPTVLIFGAGIYLQGAENCTVTGNTVYKACINNNNELLTPGAIGLANTGSATITGNSIYDSKRFGIYVNDAVDLGDPKGVVVISDNIINTCVKSGIKTTVKSNVVISNNGITNTEYGIVTSGGSSNVTRNFYNIIGNIIRACSQTGINLAYLSGVIVKGNTIEGVSTHGISANNCSDITIDGNTIKTASSRGIEIGATCSGLNKVYGNQVSGCGTGVLINAPATFKDNTIENNTTNLSGSYIPFANLGDNATPDVRYRDIVTVAPSVPTTYTNFLNGYTGQILTIQATNNNATIAHNANIILQGGTNFAMSSNSIITLLKTAGVWVEVSRKT